MTLGDFLRRIGLLPGRDRSLERGAEGARSTGRKPAEKTVVMPRSSGAPEPASAAPAAPGEQPAALQRARPTVVASPAPGHPSETSREPAMAVVPPAQEESEAEPRPTPGQPAEAGGVDALAETRVVSPPGEKPLGQVVGVLVAVEGELEGSIFSVVSGSNRVGRHPECEVCLSSEWISRHHAKIEYEDGVFVIEASSDKPTLLNSERIERDQLHDGDDLILGKTTLRFRSVL